MEKFYIFFQGFSQGASSPGLARKRAIFLIVWKVLHAHRRAKPSTRSNERAEGAQKNHTLICEKP